ncbi:T9SS type A sorting domain-containing protein [Flavobacterium sp. MAH-1]|uniref:T9SS type A sorting domain-containing protein n=1 Tax=Flavobacterium agri TaxID=2743471 RepID=A0A7Y9C6L1_9FLAO|nr:Calx-beta domain-containing protein [Flavobacterium agri]NUY80448.1 T9SS type A sorting domain-containing protein [Flavobacterium agri]NYA70473.1 T9SS type A sorting domain-containing protein [Flavobacterium agri]
MKQNYPISERWQRLRSFLMLSLVFFACQALSAQVTIPAGNTYGFLDNRPISVNDNHERLASYYTAAELGIAAGSSITGIRYYLQTANGPQNTPLKVYLSNAGTGTSFFSSIYSNVEPSGAAQYSGTMPSAAFVPGGWINIPFATPVTYTGNNIRVVVATDGGNSISESINAKQFRWSLGPTNSSQYWYSWTSPFDEDDYGVPESGRPNIQIFYTTPGSAGHVSFDNATFTASENTMATITVNRNGGSTGAVSINYATSDGTAIAGTDYTAVSGTLTWADGDMTPKTFTIPVNADFVLDNAETINLTLSNPNGTTIANGATATLTITDVLPPMQGTYTVGVGGDYPSLTNDGGIFQAINTRIAGVSGPLTINIISDITGETGKHALNEIASGQPVLIQPFGAPRTVTGTLSNSVDNLGLFRFEGTDNVTINGSLTGATAASCLVGGDASLRQLSFVNNTSANSAVILFQSAAAGANNNTVKNINTKGYAATSGYGVMFRMFPNSIAVPSTAHNENNRVENCSAKKVATGFYSAGVSVSNQDMNLVITQNEVSGTGTDRVGRNGVFISHQINPQVTYNKVFVETPSAYSISETVALAIGSGQAYSPSVTSGGISGALVANNLVTGATNATSFGGSAAGIAISGTSTGAPNVIQNNMISNVAGLSQGNYHTAGIWVVGAVASVTKLYHNTINLYGDRGAGSIQSPSYGIAISGLDPSVEMKNNIISTTQIASGTANTKTYAFGTLSSTFNNLVSDNNVFYIGGAQAGGFRSGGLSTAVGTAHANLAAWQAVSGKDANSIQVLPVFASQNDLHLVAGSNPTIDGIGTPIPSVTTDYDCFPRNLLTPTPGASESNVAGFAISASAGTGGTVTPAGTTNVPTGTNQTYTITPNCAYLIADVLVDGVSQGAITTYTFSNVSANHTISATFTAVVPTITASGATTFCQGGSVTLTSSATTGNVWSNGATTQSITVSATGNYSVTFNNGTCASAPSAVTAVTVNPAPATPTISASGATTFCQGGSVTLTSSAATGNTWSTGATTQSITVSASGNYTVSVSNGTCASASSAATTVTVNPIPAQPTISASGATTFCQGGSVTLTSSSATGNLWSTGATTQSITVTQAGIYSVSVTNSGCTSAVSANTNVTVTPLPVTPTITASGATTFCQGGSVTLTSSISTGNLWSNGATTQSITVTASGNYSVSTTSGGCTSNASAATTVTVNPLPATPTITPTGATTFCQGGNVTLISSSATGNVWSNGATTQFITVSASGTYSVYVDNGTCDSAVSNEVTVTVNPATVAPTISASGATTFCQGGSVTLTSSAATGNTWSNGATTQSITVSASGNYTVSVAGSGCGSATSAATTITVNPLPATPTISASGTTTFCQGGSVTLTSSSATGNNWSNGATTQSITVSASGTYSVFVDNGSCASATSATTTVTVNPLPATPTVSASGATTFCQGGSVTLTSSSATGNIWSTGATTQSITVSASGNYSVTVDNGTCSSAASTATTVTVNPLPTTPTISASGVTTFCQGGEVTLTSSSATGNVWSNGATTQSITVSASGNYSVTVNNGNCDSAASTATTVTVNALPTTPTISASGATTFCEGGSVTLTSSSATGNIWSTGATTQSITVSASGNYSVTVDNGTCSSAASTATTVTVNPLPATPTISASGATTFCEGGEVTLTSSSATGNVWSTGATTQSITVSASGNYSVSVNNGNCDSLPSSEITISVTPAPNAAVTLTSGILTAAQAGATYEWYTCANVLIAGENGQSFTPTVIGDYYAVITVGECSATSACIPVTELGVRDLDPKAFRIYPNPVSDVLNIEYEGELTQVEIFSLLGQKIMAKQVNAAQTQIDMSGLPAGTFLVKASSENASKTFKIVKK